MENPTRCYNWHLSSIKASLEHQTYNLGLMKPEEKNTAEEMQRTIFFS